MLTISADVSLLSHPQRQALSSFILNFPQHALDEPSPEQVFSSSPSIEEVTGPQLVVVPSTDKDGLPWDERIHSSSKALTADGLWRKKRGVEEALVAQVEGQLKQLMSVPSPVQQEVVATPAIPAPPRTPEVLPPAPVVVDGRQAFINLVGRVSAAIPQKKITMEEVQKACSDAGVPTLPLLANRADLIPQVAMTIEALIASR